MKLQFAQVPSRCLFTTTPCSFVSSLSNAPLTQRVSSTPFHPHAHLSFPHPSSLAVPLNTVVHGHVRSQCPPKNYHAKKWLLHDCSHRMALSLFWLCWNDSANDKKLISNDKLVTLFERKLERRRPLLHASAYSAPCRRDDPRAAVAENGYAARGPLTYTLC